MALADRRERGSECVMNSPRRSYEARVLLVPLGPDAARLAGEMADGGLDGVVTLTPGSQDGYDVRPVGGHGWLSTASGRAVDDVVPEADMVVLLASDLAEVPAATCLEVSRSAQDSGVLIAALVVGSRHWDTTEGNSAMVALRESVDMLVVVRSLRLAAPFLDVLRGGARRDSVSV
jgi:hypothetical protein